MTHFQIRHINDVLPHIEGRKDFVVAHKDGYSVIDYVFAGDDTFDDPMRLECRGIKFAHDGAVLARPLHKFMNIGQTPDTQPDKIDFSRPHTIMEKLDGSMIHTAIVGGEVVFMTRMGRTDVAIKAERHLTPEIERWARDFYCYTPVFEWTAPDNRIVVRYDKSALTLLAVRNNFSGEYVDKKRLAEDAASMAVPVVKHHTPQHTTAADFLAYARAIQGVEGFVVRFDSGLWVKAKCDDYVLKHRAKGSILQEKNILALVLNGRLDDVLPLLDEPYAKAAREYAAAVESGLHKTAQDLAAFVVANDSVSQKEYAVDKVAALPAYLRPLAFRARKASALSVVHDAIATNTGSQTQVDAYRALHGAFWRI